VLDENELARMVQAKFPALCRVILRIESGYAVLGLAGSAKDLIRSGFCNSRMIARLPPCGVKRYQGKCWPHVVKIKRLRNEFRIETTYYWAHKGVNREEITATLGLPPGALMRSDPVLANPRPLPALARALAKRYPGLRIEEVNQGCSYDGQIRQLVIFVGSKAEMIRAGLLTREALTQIEAREKKGQCAYTECGDSLSAREYSDGEYTVMIHTRVEGASADENRYSNSKKLQAQIERLLRPFARGTWAAAAKTVRP
jgi:hypothetical protein